MEPCWVIGLKLSKGLKDLKWTAATVLFLIASMYLLAIAIDMDLPVGTAYAVWTGIGAIGAFIAGILLLNESSERHPSGIRAVDSNKDHRCPYHEQKEHWGEGRTLNMTLICW